MVYTYKQFHFCLSNSNIKQEGLCEDFPVMFGYLLKIFDTKVFFP